MRLHGSTGKTGLIEALVGMGHDAFTGTSAARATRRRLVQRNRTGRGPRQRARTATRTLRTTTTSAGCLSTDDSRHPGDGNAQALGPL